MVRKKEDGRWEGRIVVGHKANGDPIFRYVYGRTQKELLSKLHQSIETYQRVAGPLAGRLQSGDDPPQYHVRLPAIYQTLYQADPGR